MKKKVVLSPQRRGNVTSVVALQRKNPLDKKAALKSKIQDILSGRSRFVIRKVPAVGSTRGKDSSTSDRQEKEHGPPSVPKSSEDVKKNRCGPHIFCQFFKQRRYEIWVRCGCLILLKRCLDFVFPSGALCLLIPLHRCTFLVLDEHQSHFFPTLLQA